MAKNIVICSDGTGGIAAKNRGTNVFKLFEAIELHDQKADPAKVQQIAFYDDGVGTQTWKPLMLLSGIFGFGLSRNVRQLYAELVRTYDPPPHPDQPERPGNEGDRIYVFGFSRGAFTVRTLVGMIARCGILDRSNFETDRELKRAVRKTYRAYRLKYAAVLQLILLRIFNPRTPLRWREYETLSQMRELTYGEPPSIRFVGVWDTVDAVGLPVAGAALALNKLIYQFKFSDMKLSPKVVTARQALAIDEERATFHPQVWEQAESDRDRIQQVWFAGVHCNVGGGYPKHGMSLVALDWMMAEAELADLRFVPEARARYRALRDVNDKLYDSRGGATAFYRYRPRNIRKYCHDRGMTPAIHISVLERIAQGTEGYAPGNLPRDSAFTDTADHPGAKLVHACSDELSDFLERQFDDSVGDVSPKVFSLLDVARVPVLRWHVAHLVSFCSMIGLLVLLYRVSRALFDSWRPAGLGESWDVLKAFADGIAVGTPDAMVALALLIVIAICLMVIRVARARIHTIYSGFWCDTRPGLREKMSGCLDPGGWTSAW